jgi:uncharacterized SAM-binding protein YcdF (DUF218 family)
VVERSGGRVVAVLGYSSRRGSQLHPICAERLARAEELAGDARAVILSGWARRTKAKPEAELMRAAWRGPDVPLVSDPDARTTADNAANVAATVSALGADELVVVTSGWHSRRARMLLRAALRGNDVRLTVETAGGRRPPVLLAREAACLVLAPLQIARARRGRRQPSTFSTSQR